MAGVLLEGSQLDESFEYHFVRFQAADLVKLEYDTRSGSIDQRVLKEFREDVDNVRKTAGQTSSP